MSGEALARPECCRGWAWVAADPANVPLGVEPTDRKPCEHVAGLTVADEWEALSERIAAAVDAVTRLGVAVDAVLAALGFTVADEGGQER